MKSWIKSAGIRAIKTFAQTLASLITVGVAMNEINWKSALSIATVAFIYSLLTSTAGLPELKKPVLESDGEIIFGEDGVANLHLDTDRTDAEQVILDVVTDVTEDYSAGEEQSLQVKD